MKYTNCPHCQRAIALEMLPSGCFSGRCDYCKSGVLAGPGDRPASIIHEPLKVVAQETVKMKDKIR